MQKRRLKSDLALTHPFNTLAEEVLMGLIRTTWQVTSRVNTVYASAELTPSQRVSGPSSRLAGRRPIN